MLKEVLAKCFRDLLKNKNQGYVDILDLKIYLTFEFNVPNEKMIDEILEKAKKENLIEIKEDKVYPLFDYMDVEIPIGIKLEQKFDIDVKKELIDLISKKTRTDEKSVIAELEKLKKENPLLMEEILLLAMAIKRNINVSKYIDIIKNNLRFNPE